VRIINKTGRHVEIEGMKNYNIKEIASATARGVVNTQKGPILLRSCTNVHTPTKTRNYI
jgi:hypothetical protein